MPYLTQPITARGALVSVLVGLDEEAIHVQRRAHRPVPQPIRLEALIDTGAAVSCIDGDLLRRLGLAPSGTIEICVPGPNAALPCDLFDVALTILHPTDPRNNSTLSATVADAQVRATGVDALIGCDLLRKWEFLFSGRSGTFTLDY